MKPNCDICGAKLRGIFWVVSRAALEMNRTGIISSQAVKTLELCGRCKTEFMKEAEELVVIEVSL